MCCKKSKRKLIVSLRPGDVVLVTPGKLEKGLQVVPAGSQFCMVCDPGDKSVEDEQREEMYTGSNTVGMLDKS